MNYIYALIDPRTDRVRYVGVTNSLRRRLYQHTTRLEGHTHKVNWLRQLAGEGFAPDIVVLEEVGENWEPVEKAWIAWFKSVGEDLTNTSHGGRGPNGAKQVGSHLEYLRTWRKGVKDSEETRARKRRAQAGVRPAALDVKVSCISCRKVFVKSRFSAHINGTRCRPHGWIRQRDIKVPCQQCGIVVSRDNLSKHVGSNRCRREQMRRFAWMTVA